jgi:hypothetical protein
MLTDIVFIYLHIYHPDASRVNAAQPQGDHCLYRHRLDQEADERTTGPATFIDSDGNPILGDQYV